MQIKSNIFIANIKILLYTVYVRRVNKVNMKYFSEYIDSLSKLISFNSIETEKKDNMPFGSEVYNALNYFLDLASSFGFKTVNYDNYIGEVVYGEGEEIGIIGHLDIVPAGNNWETPPFTLTLKDGVYYGRGILDDKGPLLACLYALRELKESNIKCNKKFRLFVGTNEETGWKDVEYLKTKTVIPEYGFSPDGNFPVSYAEKGVQVVEFKTKKLKNFYGIKGGTAINAVCDRAEVYALDLGINKSLLDRHGLILDGNKIISIGKSAHGSCPKDGINAIKKLYEYFLDVGEDVKDILDYLFLDTKKIMELKNEQGVVTFSPDLISEEKDYISIKCDFRIPAPFTCKEVVNKINTFNIPYSLYKTKHEPFMIAKDDKFLLTMLDSYNKITGEKRSPISMGGSTFARVFSKGVAFGPEFIGEDASIHQANEHVRKELLEKLCDIYTLAILDLAKN